MSRLARNISANLLSNVWSTALSILLTPVYVGLLGVESFGLIGFYLSWTAILGILDTGISSTAMRETAWLSARPAEKGQIPSLLRTLEVAYWGIMITIGAVLLLGAWWFGGHWFRTVSLSPEIVRNALMLMVVSLVVQVPSGLYLGGLMGLQRQVESSALVALFGTLRGFGAVGVLMMVAPDIRLFFLWQILVSAAQTGVMRWSLLNAVRPGSDPAHFSGAMLRSSRRFAGGMSLVTALSLALTQMDKMLLSRLISLEAFGFYMLAWTVASGLTRVGSPLLSAFGPRFTELVSVGDDEALARQLRMASQLTSTLILPPAALLVLLPNVILVAWTGNAKVAAGAAPLLAVLAVGTVLVACSYPALMVLYSRMRLRPVIAVNAAAVVVLLPVLAFTILEFGGLGAAFSWALYGLIAFVAFQTLGFQGLPGMRLAPTLLRNFVVPALASLAVAWVTWSWSAHVEGRIETAALIGAGLIVGWTAALAVCRELLTLTVRTFRWSLSPTL